MKTITLVLTIGLALATTALAKDAVPPTPADGDIDLVICLDTSGSMQGLIEAAKQKLWDIVNELGRARPTPHLRVALYVYGTPGYGRETGYVRQLIDLTDDLDSVYAKLTPLRTDGGDEYVARVVRAAVQDQPWSAKKQALKIIVVAGNEPATQDPEFKTPDVCKQAITRGIIVNTIYCGGPANPEAEGWRDVARLADGQFASIDHDQGTIIVNTPFDQKLAELSTALNGTYLGYGGGAKEAIARQAAMDAQSVAASPAAGASRAVAKSGGQYRNAGWDLLDASREPGFDLDSLKKDELPAVMQKMTAAEQQAYLAATAQKREAIQKEINAVNAERQKFIAAELRQGGKSTDKAFDAALLKAIREQAARCQFTFE